jgi:LysM repeat protein
MMRRLAVIFLVFLISSAVFAADITTVTLPLMVMEQGASNTVVGHIDCPVGGCSAFDVTITFDASVIQIDSAEVGPYLGEQVVTAENTIDNEQGIVHLAAAALGEPPENAENVLFKLIVVPFGSGVTQLQITHLDMGDLVGNPMEALTIDGGVVVMETSAATTNDVPDQADTETETDTQPTTNAEEQTVSETTPVDTEADSSEQVTCEYTVSTGDTLSGIALANKVTVSEIMALNEITNPRVIRVGQVLTVPASDCVPAATSGNIIEVFDCTHLGNNVFEWYSVRGVFDASGNPVKYDRIGGPYTGAWRPGCPAGEPPPKPSHHSSHSSGGDADVKKPGNDTTPPSPVCCIMIDPIPIPSG